MTDVRGAYAFAATQAEVLAHVPCYCGCERDGHRSNADCYLAGRTAANGPVWNDHAFT
jgi:hypothetical protein